MYYSYKPNTHLIRAQIGHLQMRRLRYVKSEQSPTSHACSQPADDWTLRTCAHGDEAAEVDSQYEATEADSRYNNP